MSNIKNKWYTVVSTPEHGVSLEAHDGFKYYLHPDCPVSVGDKVWLWNSETASMGRPEGVREVDEGVIECWLDGRQHWIMHRKDFENAVFLKVRQDIETLEEQGKICKDYTQAARVIGERMINGLHREEYEIVEALRSVLDQIVNMAWDALEEEYELQLDQAAMERNTNVD